MDMDFQSLSYCLCNSWATVAVTSKLRPRDTMNHPVWSHPVATEEQQSSVSLCVQHAREDPCQNDSHVPLEEFTTPTYHPKLSPEIFDIPLFYLRPPRGLEREVASTVPVSVVEYSRRFQSWVPKSLLQEEICRMSPHFVVDGGSPHEGLVKTSRREWWNPPEKSQHSTLRGCDKEV